MSIIEVTQKLDVYEFNGEEITGVAINVNSHWNRHEWVVLGVGDNLYVVCGDDLKTAINNAMNSGHI